MARGGSLLQILLMAGLRDTGEAGAGDVRVALAADSLVTVVL